MKKKRSIIVVTIAAILVVLILSFCCSKQSNLSSTAPEKYHGEVMELLIENDAGDVIDPTVSFIRDNDQLFIQFDGLIDATEVLGLDENYDLADDFDILLEIDGEWLLIDNNDQNNYIINTLTSYAIDRTPLSNDFYPEEYLQYDNFEEIFYNMINERIIES